jgi:hypothetical protein
MARIRTDHRGTTTSKRHELGDQEFEWSYIWFEEIGFVEVEVFYKIPLLNFNPPLIDPKAPLLV